MSVFRVLAIALVAAPFASGCDRGNEVEAQPKQPPRLEREKPFPDLVRKLLRDQMVDHRSKMNQLLTAALVLDHGATETLAFELARTPPLPRRIDTSSGPIKPELVTEFITHQDSMRRAAESLAIAARARDNKLVARAYGRLAESCVGCHAAYLAAPRPGK